MTDKYEQVYHKFIGHFFKEKFHTKVSHSGHEILDDITKKERPHL